MIERITEYGRCRIALALSVLLAGLAGWAQADERCGLKLKPGDEQIVDWLTNHGAYDLPVGIAGDEPLTVMVTFHVVRRSDGTGGLSEDRLAQVLEDLNTGYTDVGITFIRCDIPTDYIDSDFFYEGIRNVDDIDKLRKVNHVPDTVNVYFTENLPGLCGISSFTFSPVQGIAMLNACSGTSWDPSTIVHEMGHYFDLFHTHETFFGEECVARTNCGNAGDRMCDTEADPQLGSNNVDGNCVYTGREPAPCEDDPPYHPDAKNFMSYTPSICAIVFSQEQIDKQRAVLLNVRTTYSRQRCPITFTIPTDYADLAGAIAAAESGDTIVLEDGLYDGPNNRNLDLAGKYVNIRSLNGPDNCIIDCQGQGQAIYYHSGESHMWLLEGLTFRNGSAGDLGVVRVNSSNPTIRNCRFESNPGFGLYMELSQSRVENCTFVGNSGRLEGGAVAAFLDAPTFVNCVFRDNTSNVAGGAFHGFRSDAVFVNCLIEGNSAPVGGAISAKQCEPLLVNCNLVKNEAGSFGGAVRAGPDSKVAIAGSILWGNTPDQFYTNGGEMDVSYSDVEGGTSGTGNIDEDPQFVDFENGDYHIPFGSPVIDHGDNSQVPADVTTDLDGNPRFVDDCDTPDQGNGTAPIVDMGVYEIQLEGRPCNGSEAIRQSQCLYKRGVLSIKLTLGGLCLSGYTVTLSDGHVVSGVIDESGQAVVKIDDIEEGPGTVTVDFECGTTVEGTYECIKCTGDEAIGDITCEPAGNGTSKLTVKLTGGADRDPYVVTLSTGETKSGELSSSGKATVKFTGLDYQPRDITAEFACGATLEGSSDCCTGNEGFATVDCESNGGGDAGLTVKLKNGQDGDTFTVTLSTGEQESGTLNSNGKATVTFDGLDYAPRTVTADFGCGAVVEQDSDCCTGGEAVASAECLPDGDTALLTINLAGGQDSDTYTITLTSGEQASGVLESDGTASIVFSGIEYGAGTATAEFGCGAVAAGDYDCTRCTGAETIGNANCEPDGDTAILTVKLKGGWPDDTYTVTLTSGEQQSGTLDGNGKATVVFTGLDYVSGTATAEWGCGAIAEQDYDCSACAGTEAIKKAKCKDKNGSNKMTVKLQGGLEGDTVTVTLSSGETGEDVVNGRGKAKVKFKDLPSGDGTATADWACGAQDTADYSCP